MQLDKVKLGFSSLNLFKFFGLQLAKPVSSYLPLKIMIITSLHLQLPFGLVTGSSELLGPGTLLPVSSLLVKSQLRQDRLVAPSDFLQVFAEIRA